MVDVESLIKYIVHLTNQNGREAGLNIPLRWREFCRVWVIEPTKVVSHETLRMNGAAYSIFDTQEHILKLGETFEKHPKSAYHTVRCKWDLESVRHVWWIGVC